MFTVKTRYSSCPDCFLTKNEYADNGHIAISVVSASEGPYAGITVNVDGIECFGKDYSCVDVNNFPEAVNLIEELGIGEDTGFVLRSGFCSYPVYKFDAEKVGEFLLKKG